MVALENFDKILTDTELINLYKSTNDKYYIEELYDRHIKLLNKIAYKYSHINFLYNYDDLISETYISLVKAAEMYNPDKATFTTFLFTVVNQRLYTLVNGATSKDKGNKILNNCISIYQTLSDTDDCTIEDMIEDISSEEAFNLPERLFIMDLHDKLDNALSTLTDRQKTVVKALNEYESAKYSASELANHLSVNTKRIYEIKDDAYMKLRRNKQLRSIWYEEFIKY